MTGKLLEMLVTLNAKENESGEQTEEISQYLINELLDVIEVQTIKRIASQETPPNAKGDTVAWSTILLTFAASGGVITTLINVLQSWLTRQDKRTLVLEIDGDKLEITGISSEEQKQLIDNWLKRHKGFLIAGDE